MNEGPSATLQDIDNLLVEVLFGVEGASCWDLHDPHRGNNPFHAVASDQGHACSLIQRS